MKKINEKKSVFWRAYAVLCIFLVVTIAAVNFLLYDFIKAFENFRPERAVEDYVSTLDSESLAALFAPAAEKLFSGFEADDVLMSEIVSMVAENEITYVAAAGADGEVFDVYCGEKILTLSVSVASGGRYGFDDYIVTGASVNEEWITSRQSTVTVIAPADASISLNGYGVSDAYVTGTLEAGSAVSEFERDDSFGYRLNVYEISGIFGSVGCTARGKDGEIALMSPAEGVYTSDYTATDSAYTVAVPEGATLTLNGIEVSDKYVSGQVTAFDAAPYEAKTAPKCTVYTVKGLRHAPETRVTLDGAELSPIAAEGYDAAYNYPDSYKSSYTVRLPDDLDLYCNGTLVPKENITSEAGEYSVPEAVKKFVKTEKTSVEYTVSGLYGEPAFTSSDENCVVSGENGVYTFYPAPTDDEMKILEDEAQSFTELYIEYSYEGTDYTKENFAKVIACVKEGSDAYDIIEVSYDSMKYNSNFKVDKLETNIYDMVKYADNCYGVKVDFESHGKYYIYEKEANGTYVMIWIVSGGEWKLAYFNFV